MTRNAASALAEKIDGTWDVAPREVPVKKGEELVLKKDGTPRMKRIPGKGRREAQVGMFTTNGVERCVVHVTYPDHDGEPYTLSH
jgi:hypothetical protein